MKTYSETIDRNFRPRLPTKMSIGASRYIVAVGIPQRGTPAPTITGLRAAVWAGEYVDDLGEVPIIAATTHMAKSKVKFELSWYVGLIVAESLNDLSTVESSSPREALLLEAAEFGVFVDAGKAVELLQTLHTHRPRD